MWLVSFEPIFVHIYRCELVLTSTAMLPFDACLFPTCRDIAKLSMLSTWLKMCTSYLIKSIWTIAMMLLHTRHQVIILVDIILKCGICVELVDRIIMLFSCVIQPFKSLRTRQNPFSTPYATQKKKILKMCFGANQFHTLVFSGKCNHDKRSPSTLVHSTPILSCTISFHGLEEFRR